jgi:hypothetical protein
LCWSICNLHVEYLTETTHDARKYLCQFLMGSTTWAAL